MFHMIVITSYIVLNYSKIKHIQNILDYLATIPLPSKNIEQNNPRVHKSNPWFGESWTPESYCNIAIALSVDRNIPLQWRHNGHDSVSNHQPHDCLLNGLFRRRSKKTSKLRVTGLCVGNSPGSGEFPAQMASNAENVSIWWRHHVWIPIPVSLYRGRWRNLTTLYRTRSPIRSCLYAPKRNLMYDVYVLVGNLSELWGQYTEFRISIQNSTQISRNLVRPQRPISNRFWNFVQSQCITVVLCGKLQSDWATGQQDKQVFPRFGFKMSLGRIYYMAQQPGPMVPIWNIGMNIYAAVFH